MMDRVFKTDETRSSTAPASDLDRDARTRRDSVLYVFFVVQIVAVTFLQKIAVGGGIAIALPLLLVSILVVTAFVKPVIDPRRAVLYGVWVLFASISTILQPGGFSGGSVFLFVLLYLPMLVSFPTSMANYRRCMETFSRIMVGMAALALAEHAIQIVASWRAWPNLDDMLPKALLIPDYIYIQKIEWSGQLMKPNAVFFLEVSFLSQFLTLALAIELLLFRRLWRIALFAGTLFATFAGTGLLLLILTLPVLLKRLTLRTSTIVLVALVVIALLAIYFGWIDTVSHRFNEYKQRGSSSNLRFVEPLERILQFLQAPDAIYRGIGPGKMEKVGYQWWPITKCVVEYGLLGGVAFYAFFLYTMLKKPPLPELAFLLVVWFSIEGALLTVLNVVVCMIFSSMFLVEAEPKRKRVRKRRSESRSERRRGERSSELHPAAATS